MLRAALREPVARGFAAKVVIDRFEAKAPGSHYTYRFLRHLHARRPRAEFFLLLGADQASFFPNWVRWKEVSKRCRIIAGARRGTPRTKISGVTWMSGKFPQASSSEIRTRLSQGKDAGGQVPESVRWHIRRYGLYGTAWIGWLKRRLKPARFAHTLEVSRLAGELAARHGLDPWKAQQAALLHDAGRAFSREGLCRYARQNSLRVPLRREMERREPRLLHAFVAADLARRRFRVKDQSVLAAIADHTLGRPGMGKLSRLIYTADASSQDRGFPEARRIRAAALRDLEKGFLMAARNKLAWVKRSGGWLHPRGQATLLWAEQRAGLRIKD